MERILATIALAFFLTAATFSSVTHAANIQDLSGTSSTIDLNLDPPGGGDDEDPPIGG